MNRQSTLERKEPTKYCTTQMVQLLIYILPYFIRVFQYFMPWYIFIETLDQLNSIVNILKNQNNLKPKTSLDEVANLLPGNHSI